MYTLLITFFLFSITFSFLCSLWEAVLLSITPSYAEIKYQEGAAIGRHLRSFKINIDQPLAAILTLNTIAHTVGAIGVGAQATSIWADTNPLLTALVVPAAMTLAILILSEIIPKTIGATHWRELARFTVASLRMVIAALYPLVWLSQLITRALRKGAKGSIYSRSDFVALTKIGTRAGVFHPSESEIIASLLRFNRVKARDIMTPRTVVVAAPETMTIQSLFDASDDLRFSRIPIYQEDDKDDITGFVLKDEVLEALVEGEHGKPLSSLRREIMVIPESFPLPELFTRLLEQRAHISLVIDEFGGMSGVVTMEDVIETLLGLEIVDESDQDEDMQQRARANWERRARARGLLAEVEHPSDEAKPD